jgi:hypothetical protein
MIRFSRLNNLKLTITASLIACLFTALPAHAMHFSVVGLADSSALKDSSSGGGSVAIGDNARRGYGGGALLGFWLIPGIEFETGGLYLTRKYDSSGDIQHAVQVPLLLRLHLLRDFSVGAGGYGALAMRSDSSSGLKKQDYGALASVALRFPIALGTAIILDGRYALGLANVNNSSSAGKETFRDIQALAGIQFNLEGGYSHHR